MALKFIIHSMLIVLSFIHGTFNAPRSNLNPADKASGWYRRSMSNYDKNVPPSYHSKTPTNVRVGMYINSIQDIDHGNSMTMSTNIYLRQSWTDPRFSFNQSDIGMKRILLPDDAREKIWIPDLFFRNQIESTIHSTQRSNILITVNSTGSMFMVMHLNLVTACPMNLAKYPFDTQTCSLMIESYRHQMDTYYLSWLPHPISIDVSIKLPGYTLIGTEKYDCSQNYTAGAFACHEVSFLLKRDIGFYFLQLFLPTIIVCIISWFSFWIDGERYTDRLFLLLVLILILFIQYAMANSKVVQVSYVKALDIWMLFCILFVFLAMVEATVIKVIGYNTITGGKDCDECGEFAILLGKIYTPKEVRRIIDIVCRISFPAAFVLMMIIYFSVYSQSSNQE